MREAAARILEAAGLAALNTNAVAEKAGVSVGSLYQYFPAKESLLVTLIRRNRARLTEADSAGTRASGQSRATIGDRWVYPCRAVPPARSSAPGEQS